MQGENLGMARGAPDPWDASPLRTVAAVLCVCVGYYVGANLGFILRLPPTTPSVMWPPNALLTTTLLLTPPRRWWLYLLAAFPAHLVAELGIVWPPSLMLTLFITNCSEALFAAIGMRWLSNVPVRFDTLRRVVGFIVVVVFLAPLFTSFADAAAVTTLRGEAYWLVWRTRLLSNVLTELTLVPALVMLITAGPAWLRGMSRLRQAEAVLLVGALCTVGLAVFAEPIKGLDAIPDTPRTRLVFLLPFLLWAMVRFGPLGTSLSLLATTVIAMWAASQGYGPFAGLPPAESALALQISLIVVAIPLMCLAALIEERQRAETALAERLRFEELLSHLSGAFVHLSSQGMGEVIKTSLQQLGEFLRLDRLVLVELSRDGQEPLEVTYAWEVTGAELTPRVFTSQDFPWAVRRLLAGQNIVFGCLGELPAEAARDRDSFQRRRVKSHLAIPLVAGGRVLGALAFVTITAERTWSDELVHRLRLIAEVFANALARKEAEDALRTSELMKSAILASLTSSVTVLDRQGRIVTVNESWMRFARQHGILSDGVGANYREVLRQAIRPDTPQTAETLAGVEAVLDGLRPEFASEYASQTADDERWFAMSVVPLGHSAGGAVMAHTDITERKRAEMEAQRSRQELAHCTRVSTIGAMTASLAHELNQPLAGILANAQAARRFLDATPPVYDEFRDILVDIVEDVRRAADVIQHLRDLLQKNKFQYIVLDLNELCRDVAKLVSSDAVIRNITVTLDVDPEPTIVRGDRVQLQQVVLNLLLNAMEAIAEGRGDDRLIVVRTRNLETRTVHVSVQDTGPGLEDGTQELVFEPFYTRKPAGLGMGLSIARLIIEAHGGVIGVTNNPTCGATFSFALPWAGGGAA
jgi:C4-dicarboxylate-specific signal transduction histidine kinase/integral membrane sensor domain MASE1